MPSSTRSRRKRLLEAYAEEGQIPVVPDVAAIEALGIRAVRASVISETDTVRHDPQRLADVVLKLVDDYVAQRSSFVRLATSPAPVREAATGG